MTPDRRQQLEQDIGFVLAFAVLGGLIGRFLLFLVALGIQ